MYDKMIDWNRLLESFVVVTLFFAGVTVSIAIMIAIATNFGLVGYLIFLSFIFAVIATYQYKGM